jgi:hypothetical protein
MSDHRVVGTLGHVTGYRDCYGNSSFTAFADAIDRARHDLFARSARHGCALRCHPMDARLIMFLPPDQQCDPEILRAWVTLVVLNIAPRPTTFDGMIVMADMETPLGCAVIEACANRHYRDDQCAYRQEPGPAPPDGTLPPPEAPPAPQRLPEPATARPRQAEPPRRRRASAAELERRAATAERKAAEAARKLDAAREAAAEH